MKKNTRWYMCVLLTIITLCLISFVIIHKFKQIEPFENNHIPNKIWTFWDNPNNVPDIVKKCIGTWKKHNPEFKITLITRENYKDFVNIPDKIAKHPIMNDSPQRFSDLIRLYLIDKYGGYWIDSSIIVSEPFSNWIPQSNKDLYGFTIGFGNPKYPVIESWFFAAPENSQFLKKWKEEFIQLCDFENPGEYVQSRKNMGTDVEGWSVSPEYLSIHVAAQKLIQVDKYPIEKLFLLKSEDGPFRYLSENQWSAEKGLHEACSRKKLRTPFLKLRGCDRSILEKYIHSSLSNEVCHWF